MKVKRLTETAKLPTRANPTDAGLDLYADEDVALWPCARVLVSTGIAIAIPEGFYGRIAPRSGLAYNHGIDVLAGVIDSSYRGEIKVLLFNTDIERKFEIKKGERIAQMIIEIVALLKVEEVVALEDTDRGNGGFGSSGN